VGDLTADDFHAVDRQIIDFMRSAASKGVEKVHVFVDSTEMGRLPSLRELEGGRILKYMAEPACGWTIVVGYSKNTFLKILSRLLTSVMGVDMFMADSLPMGLSMLKQVVPSLTDLPDIVAWKAHIITLTDNQIA
jgi:hypothetical protein